jgi:carboxypeptidase C (cathepsin A)
MYNGDLDFVGNWVGGEKSINGLEWVGQSEWQKVGFQNIGYGLKRELANLAFIKFSNAGHMVPMDQPENALKMLNWFIEEWRPEAL